jgi:hypothetical protein
MSPASVRGKLLSVTVKADTYRIGVCWAGIVITAARIISREITRHKGLNCDKSPAHGQSVMTSHIHRRIPTLAVAAVLGATRRSRRRGCRRASRNR